jgi:hypothetical protein
MFSKEWVYDKIFGLAEDEVNEIRSNFVDDAKEYYRLESIQNEGNDPADPNQPDEGGEDEGWGFGEFDKMTDEEKAHAKEREKEEKKRKNAEKEYDHPDNKPMGRDPLGADERRVNGRDWGDSPLKLETDLSKLDNFLNKKQPTTSTKSTQMSKLICEVDKENTKKKTDYLDDKNIIEK